ncbi:hypothetical protein ASG90_17520 [Nocardioides sp. Soil797]|nr:hypothetical protein ASG90_17520 [Nocardioides sp. Soil797]
MDWATNADTASLSAVLGLVAGWFVPRLVAVLPEPTAPKGSDADGSDADGSDSVDDQKPLYADLAATPGIARWTAGWTGLVAGLFGAALGWAWPLLYLLPLVPIGVALAWVDARTRLLPRIVVLPTYLLVLVLIPLTALLARDLDALVRAGLGWLAVGFVYWFLWRFTPGMGYGDVRLSGILGMALGFLGWAELVVGAYAGFLIGALGWVPLRLLRITRDRNFPFGPFMLLGAVVGVLWGADLGGYLAGRQG